MTPLADGKRVGVLALPVVAIAALGVGALMADQGQQGTDPPPPTSPPSQDTIQLVFEREVFSYPSGARRNPFRPLTGPGDAGPRFEELVLLGAIQSLDPASSVALLAVGSGGVPEQTYRLRVGQRLGNIRVVEIRSSREIVVVVDEFGLQERRMMEVRRTAPEAAGPPGGGPPVQDQQSDTIPPDSAGTAGGTGGEDGGATGSGSGSGPDVGTNGNGDI